MMTSTRRGFVHGLSGLLAYAATARAAQARTRMRAVPADAQFFLFLQIHGAWDVCLAFDPKDREALLPNGTRQFDQPYAAGDIRDFGNGLRLAPDGALFGAYADRMAVVNGIDMEVDNGHMNDFVMTGFNNPRASNLPYVQSVLAKRQPWLRRCSIPHLFASYDGQFFPGPYATSSLTSTPADFLSLIGDPSAGGGGLANPAAILSEFRNGPAPAPARRGLDSYLDAIARAQEIGAKLRDGGFHAPSTTETAAGAGDLIAQLFASGALGAATLSFGFGSQFGTDYEFDTHSDHYAKHPLKQFLIDANALIAALAAAPLDEHTSVLERTTVVMTAEYCRTPLLNGAGGKDHNIRANSVVLLGHGVRPGVFGATGARTVDGALMGHAALPVDFATGQPSETGKIMNIRNIWAGLSGLAGVDVAHEFGVDTVPVAFLG